MIRFKNRIEAGRLLANKLEGYKDGKNVIALAVPQGGVPVGFEISRILRIQLDILIMRKLTIPGQEELPVGAIAPNGYRIINDKLVNILGISEKKISATEQIEQKELNRLMEIYRNSYPAPILSGKTVILINDGLVTGTSMSMRVKIVRSAIPEKIVVAVPVASHEAVTLLQKVADEVISVITPVPFISVQEYYDDFTEIQDTEIREMLTEAQAAIIKNER